MNKNFKNINNSDEIYKVYDVISTSLIIIPKYKTFLLEIESVNTSREKSNLMENNIFEFKDFNQCKPGNKFINKINSFSMFIWALDTFLLR